MEKVREPLIKSQISASMLYLTFNSPGATFAAPVVKNRYLALLMKIMYSSASITAAPKIEMISKEDENQIPE